MRVWFYTNAQEIAAARAELLDAQAHRCAICDKKLLRGIPDHCHRHGIIRGILCNQCNTGLGMFGDSIDNLLAAITYLRRAAQTVTEIEASEGEQREQLRSWRLKHQAPAQRKRADAYAKSDVSGEVQ